MATNTDPEWCRQCLAYHSEGIHWPTFFREHGADSLKAFGWPEEGDRNVGNVEQLYQRIKERLMDEIAVDVHGAPNYGRLVPMPESSESSGT